MIIKFGSKQAKYLFFIRLVLTILFLQMVAFPTVLALGHTLYCKIQKFGVGDEVAQHLTDLGLVDCFKRQEEDNLYLKCWKDNELYNVDIKVYVEPITI